VEFLPICDLKVRQSTGRSLEVPETRGLLYRERDAIALTAVFSVRAFSWNCENPRTKIIFLRASRIALVWRAKKPSRPEADR
jgi:hypothetical protein